MAQVVDEVVVGGVRAVPRDHRAPGDQAQEVVQRHALPRAPPDAPLAQRRRRLRVRRRSMRQCTPGVQGDAQ